MYLTSFFAQAEQAAAAVAQTANQAAAAVAQTANQAAAAVAQTAPKQPSLSTLDWIVIAGYFAIIALIAWNASRQQESTSDYFLGGRNIGWFAIGGSLFASNIGSEHIVGLAGNGATIGMSMAHWELHSWVLLMLGWVFVPYYYNSKVFTMPEFLEKRFNATARWILSIISLAAYVLTKVSVTVYAGAMVFQVMLPDLFPTPEMAFWVGAILTVILTGIYTVFGGLRAVLYTDAAQAIILLLGSIFIFYFGLKNLNGGWSGVQEFVSKHAETHSLWHPLSNKDYPWLAICIASPIIGIWYWCTDQYIVQRTLAAKDLTTARRGTIWGAGLKVMPVMLFLVPGMIGAALSEQGFLADGTPFSLPAKVVNGEVVGINGDVVFPTLVKSLLPSGIRGIVVAGLLAALMSSLSSLFNSSASLFTVDIYQKLKPQSSQKELVYVGKIATVVVVGLGLLWIPIMPAIAGGGLYDYLQNVQSFLAPSIAAVFLLGIFWSRTNGTGAVWGLGVGFVLGMSKLTIQGICKGQGGFLGAIADFNAYYTCGILLVISIIVIVIASLATPAPDKEHLEGLTMASINKAEVKASIKPIDYVTTGIVILMIVGVYLYFSFWI